VAPPGSDAEARADRFLRHESVVWLSTVSPDRRPHLVPTWFWWDGRSVLIATKPDAQKVANLRANPTCMLAIGDAAANFDVALMEARAELTTIPTRRLLDAGLQAQYRDRMPAVALDTDEFESTYSQVIRLTPTRCLPWRGRPGPETGAGAGRRRREEPERGRRRVGALSDLGLFGGRTRHAAVGLAVSTSR
jgi:PPOX class probable F420-dependent enzyme